jgi:hypothetical protein
VTASDGIWHLIAPTAATAPVEPHFAPRDPAAVRRPWGFIDTSKVNADLFIQRVRERARDEFGVDSVVVAKPAPGLGLTDAQADDLAGRCGVVVACFGD